MERFIAVDNVCAWPKLTLMKDGNLLLDVHNRPSHGSPDGSAECWRSEDDGKTWSFQGVSGVGSIENGPFIDKACGMAHNGDYLVIVENRLETDSYIFRSKDGGKTFAEVGRVRCDGAQTIPYGAIIRIGESTLAVNYWICCDKSKLTNPDAVRESHILISRDDGASWTEDYVISQGINETAILFYDEMEGIAIGRADEYPDNPSSGFSKGNLKFRTLDGGKTWKPEGQIMGHEMVPPHLTMLADGQTLLGVGFRFANRGGIMVSLSPDKGKSWGDPNILVDYPCVDGGYPSSVQMPDGTIVTAYYCSGCEYHTRYFAGVIRWRPEELLEARWIGRPASCYYGTDKEFLNEWRMP